MISILPYPLPMLNITSLALVAVLISMQLTAQKQPAKASGPQTPKARADSIVVTRFVNNPNAIWTINSHHTIHHHNNQSMKTNTAVSLVFCSISFMVVDSTTAQVAHADTTILSSFYQNEANNCASIALIKAAMHKFGYNKILKYKKEKDNFVLTLRNGQKLKIDEADLSTARRHAQLGISTGNFAEKDSVILYAHLAYASIAKYIAKHGYYDCEENEGRHLNFKGDFEDALIFMSRTSFCTDYCYRLLGLEATTKTTNNYTGTPFSETGIILYSWRHAVFAIGDKVDCYGDWETASSETTCGQKFKFYLVLK